MYELQIIIVVIVALVIGAGAFYFFSRSSKDSVQCPDKCSNNGLCSQDGTCKCDKGYTGFNCSKEDKPVTCPNNCSSHGLCNNGTCTCNQGFGGPDCSTNTCPPGYAGPGCLNCDVAAGYTFDPVKGKCIVNRCSPQCTGSNGSCVDASSGICKCNPGYFGQTCQISCKNGATFDNVNQKCICASGFGGSDCSMECKMGTFDIHSGKTTIPLPLSYCNSTLGGGSCMSDTGTCKCINDTAFDANKGCGFASITQTAVDLAAGVLIGMLNGQCPNFKKDGETAAISEFIKRWSADGFNTGDAAQIFKDVCNCPENEVGWNPDTKQCRLST